MSSIPDDETGNALREFQANGFELSKPLEKAITGHPFFKTEFSIPYIIFYVLLLYTKHADSYVVPVRKPIKNGGLFWQVGTDRDQISAQEQIKSTFHAGLLKTQSKLTIFKYNKSLCKA